MEYKNENEYWANRQSKQLIQENKTSNCENKNKKTIEYF